jgi:hypothetical protein
MNSFPRTNIGGLSVSRMVIGTNWFLGWSHTTDAKDCFIKENIADRKKIADILEVFLKADIDTIMGQITYPPLADAIKDAEDRSGKKMIIISTPHIPFTKDTPINGFDTGVAAKILDEQAEYGTAICMPHQGTTDSMVDRCSREVRKMDKICAMIRERGMRTGLSTHMPESIIYADETDLDVDTYISMYNSMGFLMQVEVDWVASIIQSALKPVITIKPMAAGQLRPFQALNFVWNTIRDCDMVTVGTMTPKEAAECIELSMSILEKRKSDTKLQMTRSKTSIKKDLVR